MADDLTYESLAMLWPSPARSVRNDDGTYTHTFTVDTPGVPDHVALTPTEMIMLRLGATLGQIMEQRR